MKIDTRLIVSRIKNAYEITITIEIKNPKLYITYTPHKNILEDEFICNIKGNTAIVSDNAIRGRPYFVVKSDDTEDLVVATRTVEVEGVDNFREQGGYLTNTGKTVKWGRFFRGGPLSSLSEIENEKEYIDGLGFNKIFDYRDNGERLNSPDYVPENTELVAIPAFSDMEDKINLTALGSMDKVVGRIKTQKNADKIVDGLKSIYAILPFQNTAYKEMFKALDSEDTSIIFQHCSAGKDRTGIGCALLLLALGVDEETVVADYCLSSVYREKLNEKYISALSSLVNNQPAINCFRRILSVEEGFIKTTFDAILSKYNSYEEFFEKEYDITKERLEHWRSIHLY